MLAWELLGKVTLLLKWTVEDAGPYRISTDFIGIAAKLYKKFFGYFFSKK